MSVRKQKTARHYFSFVAEDGAPRYYYNFSGVGIESLTYEEMIGRVDRWLENKESRSHHIACINAYCVALATLNARLKTIYNRSDIAGPDGMPFVRWIRTFTGKRCDRFAAPDLALFLAKRAEEKGYTFYLYGGAPDVLERMYRFLMVRFPKLQIVGRYSPPFRPMTAEEDRIICEEINRLGPDIILVGLGTPKQDYWIDDHVEKLRGSVLLASGATFDFFGGRIKFAPGWVRTSGFEWLYRLLSRDFRRLWGRYTYYNYVFLKTFFMQLISLTEAGIQRTFREK